MGSQKKQSWNSDAGYIWSLIGSAIGFANLLGFGSQCYKNGGGAFLIPFFIALFVLGVPMLMMEGIMGQSSKLPLITLYGRTFGKKGKFLGWLSILGVLTIGSFYIVLTGWTLAYCVFSAQGIIPNDTAAFFANDFLKATGTLTHLGPLSLPSLLGMIVVSFFSYYVISKNIQSGIEKWCSLFLPLLTAIILLFVGAVFFLPGASSGFYHYLYPDFAKILDLRVWKDVFGQLFFSLSIGLGIVVGYSRYTEKKTNIMRAMMQVALADFLISFVAGFVIFGCVGYMAKASGIAFEDIVKTTSSFEMGYVIFPLILSSFGPLVSKILGPIFFFSLFIAGITGVFSIAESIAGNIESEFHTDRKKATFVSISMITLLAIPFCFGSGTALMDALEPMVLGNNMLIAGITQILVFMYLSKSIRDHEIWFVGQRRSFFYYSLKYASLALLLMTLYFSIKKEADGIYGLPELVRGAWFVGATLISASLTLFNKDCRLKRDV